MYIYILSRYIAARSTRRLDIASLSWKIKECLPVVFDSQLLIGTPWGPDHNFRAKIIYVGFNAVGIEETVLDNEVYVKCGRP